MLTIFVRPKYIAGIYFDAYENLRFCATTYLTHPHKSYMAVTTHVFIREKIEFFKAHFKFVLNLRRS